MQLDSEDIDAYDLVESEGSDDCDHSHADRKLLLRVQARNKKPEEPEEEAREFSS